MNWNVVQRISLLHWSPPRMCSFTVFNLFINDIAELLKKENCGILLGDALISILLYADDIVLVADNEIDLQDMVDKLQTFCDQSMMKVNISKTQWMVFEQKLCIKTGNISLLFDGKLLEEVKVFKYLGVYFSQNLKFSDHVKFVLIKAEKAAHQFWKYINRFNCLKTSIIINLFHTLVVPVLLYCSEIWFPCISSADITHIENFYKKTSKEYLESLCQRQMQQFTWN